ncbi:hypothetical protein RvY_03213 [Ramazzottius varieornatus]|uniref:MD-2-related lipid-recognition domain-containing protein n=1 Tax=Ramazzottius varieornatus TaxID=947166 RepID=A0A1D1UWP6_RAMVA|nr:hypothetical protein RvY_03213 [Ramazzottius varieornatus]
MTFAKKPTFAAVVLLFCLGSSFVSCLSSGKRGHSEEDNLIQYNWDELLLARARPHHKAQPKLHPTQKVYPVQRKLAHFSWKSCGGPDDAIKLTNLTLSPDPLQLGQPLKVTASGEILRDITAPIEIDVVVEKKVFVWVNLPCVDDFGSCNYADVCSRLPPPPCPQPIIEAKLPCSCPFPIGKYSVKDLEYEIDTKQYPPELVQGDFKFHIVIKQKNQSIGCYDFELSIKK